MRRGVAVQPRPFGAILAVALEERGGEFGPPRRVRRMAGTPRAPFGGYRHGIILSSRSLCGVWIIEDQ
jgi:hypothetical protein